MLLSLDKTLIASLQNSLAFQTTLASKELSHSNILGFMLERSPSLANGLLGPIAIRKVQREQPLGRSRVVDKAKPESCHADVYVEAENASGPAHFVIELKVKSLATAEQLERYGQSERVRMWKDAGEPVNLILIAPVPPNRMPNGWRFVPFAVVLDQYAAIEQFSGKGYELNFLYDYVEAFRALFGLLQSLSESIVTERTQMRWAEVMAFANRQEFQRNELRIHDLVQKFCFSSLAAVVRSELPPAVSSSRWTPLDLGISLANKSKQGLIDLGWVSIEGESVGIQLEGRHYRHFASGVPLSEPVPALYTDWLSCPAAVTAELTVEMTGLKKRSKNGERGSNLSFLNKAAGTRFIHRQVKLKEGFTVAQIAKLIANDLVQLARLLGLATSISE